MRRRPVSFDRIASAYRWMEYLTFARALERCRFAFLDELGQTRRALVYGDGDGRFLARLLDRHPHITAEAVDSSAAMLRIAELRVRKLQHGGQERVRFHHSNALSFEPGGEFDLIATHFFLDCFSEAEIVLLLERLRGHVAPAAYWVVSEFAIPPQRKFRYMAGLLIAALYRSFALLTGLRTRRLPDYAALLGAAGFSLRAERVSLKGLLRSELWQRVP